MLQIETAEPGIFSLLEKLQSIPELKDFFLVGGTALSLMFGHRISEDLDLFSAQLFDNSHIQDSLYDFFGNEFKVRSSNPKIGIFSFIEEVKIDLVKHPFPLLRPVQETGMSGTSDFRLRTSLPTGHAGDVFEVEYWLTGKEADNHLKN